MSSKSMWTLLGTVGGGVGGAFAGNPALGASLGGAAGGAIGGMNEAKQQAQSNYRNQLAQAVMERNKWATGTGGNILNQSQADPLAGAVEGLAVGQKLGLPSTSNFMAPEQTPMTDQFQAPELGSAYQRDFNEINGVQEPSLANKEHMMSFKGDNLLPNTAKKSVWSLQAPKF